MAVSQWVNAQEDLKFVQNPMMREVQKIGEHKQVSSHLYFLLDIQTNADLDRTGPFDTPTVIHDLDITAVWFLIF